MFIGVFNTIIMQSFTLCASGALSRRYPAPLKGFRHEKRKRKEKEKREREKRKENALSRLLIKFMSGTISNLPTFLGSFPKVIK